MNGYFYININNNPNIKTFETPLCGKQFAVNYNSVNSIIKTTISYFKNDRDFDRILYDYKEKPSDPKYRTFLEMYLDKLNNNDNLVVRSIFQLGNTKLKIYRALSILRTKQVRLFVNDWEVDISITMKLVLDLSAQRLANYENQKLKENNCYDWTSEFNIYRTAAGYTFIKPTRKKDYIY